MNTRKIDAIFRANSLQQGFIYHAISQADDDAYRVQLVFDYKQPLNVENYIRAWELSIEKFPILRTAFNWEEEMIQIVFNQADLNHQLLDISDLSSEDQENYIINLQEEDRKIPFDLTVPCLMRLFVLKLADEHYTIIKSEHHSIADGWSGPLLLNDVHQHYTDLQVGKSVQVRVQNSYLEAQDYFTKHQKEVEEFWEKQKKTLGKSNDLTPLLSFKQDLDNVRSLSNTFTSSLEIKGKQYDQLKSLAKDAGVTLNTMIQFAWHKLIQIHSQDSQTIVGTTISGRTIPVSGIEESVGMYINTLPLIINWENEHSILEQIRYIHEEITALNSHSFYNLAGLQTDGKRLFHSLFIFENYPMPAQPMERDVNQLIPQIRYGVEKIDYPVGIIAFELGDQLIIQLKSDHSVLTEQKAQENLNKIQLVLDQITEDADKKHNEISTLSTEARQQLLFDWNDNDQDFPQGQTIQKIFEANANQHPEHIALTYETTELTFQELNHQANQLARYIGGQVSINTDTPIVIFMDRSPEMIISLLAILKSGGAYVPVSPDGPIDRIQSILEDVNTPLALTQSKWQEKLKEVSGNHIITSVDEIDYQSKDTSNLNVDSNDRDLAYIIYTSGTSGKPKGVMIEHASVSNYIHNVSPIFENIENVDFSSNLSFDLSVTTTLVPLCLGKTICIYSGKLIEVDNYVTHLEKNNIDFVKSTPSFLTQIPFEELSFHIKSCFIGGEKSTRNQLNYLNRYIDEVYDEYGPTEATVGTTTILNYDGVNSIGKAYKNYRIYVLDNNLQPVPIDVPGELHIGGAGISRGYLKRPELNDEKFIHHPFPSAADKEKGYDKLYKTGDLVKWLPDGTIEYIGRNDFQVKIRGYRIELGEIETAISEIDGVQQACVLCHEDHGNKQLIGYFTSETNIEDHSIETLLQDRLPEYMIPETFIRLEKFPLTSNGKLDRNALPEPMSQESSKDHVALSGELEKQLGTIYSEVLNLSLDEISSKKSFFRMGGNSILTIKLLQKLKRIDSFSEITVADLFKYDSIFKLGLHARGEEKTTYREYQQNNGSTSEIAIIGTSGAFSGTNNISEFWHLISNQLEGIEFFTKEECEALGVNAQLIEHPSFVPVSGKVKNIEFFDPAFWNISPKEAKFLDPQIRKLAEHCWFALESSGYAETRKTQNIGVFAGSGVSTYFAENILKNEALQDMNIWEVSNSNSKDATATKLAYMLGLTGPANSINTACSTSLVTVIEACKNLQLGICDMALAGGATLSMPQQIGYIHEEGMILSKTGHCSTFDKNASGTTGGSGAGVVLLKRLEDAQKDGDPILGVIKGYATNNDGDRKTGYTAPSVIGQSECIINAQKMAGVSSHEIDYVECHGTATKLGDPIEIQALKEAFDYNSNGKTTNAKCQLGAVKANIGHADAAAGIAGLIKVCSMLENNTIPGQVNFEQANPELHIDSSTFEIATKNSDWSPNEHKQRLAGVSSFGIGGTNAHIIIGDYNNNSEDHISEESKRLVFPISAKHRKSVNAFEQELISFLSDEAQVNISLTDLAFTLQERRSAFGYRSAYSAVTKQELIEKLQEGNVAGDVNFEERNQVVFMYPGQGAQYRDMAGELYNHEPRFKRLLDRCIRIANQHLTVDLSQVLFKNDSTEEININDTEWAQIALFSTSYALSKYMEELGVSPVAHIGHSISEYVAATLSGVFRLEDAIKVVIERGRLMQSMESGSMLAIQSDETTIEKLSKQFNCEIAVCNSQKDIVVSGTDQEIDSLKQALDKKSIPSIKLNTSHAYHSRMMEPASQLFEKVFDGIQLHRPEHQSFVSNLTGNWADEQVTTPDYWCKQLRNRVEFGKGIATVSENYNHRLTFVEIGTGKGLSSFVKAYAKSNHKQQLRTVQLLPSLKEKNSESFAEIRHKEDVLALLWSNKIIEQPNHVESLNHGKLLPKLPNYQFNYQKCWLDARPDQSVQPYSSETTSDEEKSIGILITEQEYSTTEHQLAQLFYEALGIEEVSIHDDFFKLGGNSISAIKLANQISIQNDAHITVADVFNHKTIRELAHFVDENQSEGLKINAKPRDFYPLSFAQERLWFIEQYEQGTSAYHIPLLVGITESTDQDQLKSAIKQVVNRHELLRTTFEEIDGRYQQVAIEDEFTIHDYHGDRETLKTQLASDINTSFDLQNEFPIRASFYHYPDGTDLLINIHHIASDGWSTDVLLREINALYHEETLPELKIQYKDFASWQREYVQGDLFDDQVNYWKEKLDAYATLDLPTDRLRPTEIDYHGDTIPFIVPEELSNKLRKLSSDEGCTLFVTLLSGFYILLNKYSSQDDIVIGTPFANRHYSEIQSLIGFFVNSAALREQLDQQKNILDLIGQVQQTLTDAQKHQDLPFEKIVELLKVPQDSSRHPVFQVMFGIQSFGSEFESSLFEQSRVENNLYTSATHDLCCFMDDSQEKIHGALNFATALFDKSTVERMTQHYLFILQQIVDAADKALKDYTLLNKSDYQRIVLDWNRSQTEYPKDKTIHQLFEEQVELYPDNIAVSFEDQQLTYAELNEKSNQLARYIQSKAEIQPDTLIALCLDRSPEMIISILGVLKSGAAYVPISPEYPKDRIEYIAEDANASLMITQSHLTSIIQDIDLPTTIDIDRVELNKLDSSNLPESSNSNDLAYVIYTSGTTGKPKGVLQTHGNVQRLFSSTDHQFNFSEKDVWTLYHSYIFDFTVWELWGALTYGGKLVVPSTEVVKDIPRFIDLCINEGVTVLNQTPAAFYTFAENIDHPKTADLALRYIIFGGDALNVNLLSNWWKTSKKHQFETRLINMYGITETTVHVTFKEITEKEQTASNIGTAIDDLTSYVLDANNNPVPIGVPGELHIGGAGLAKGYLNRPELTKERFLDNPFASQEEIERGYTKLYKTGDLVRWLPNGDLEYIGRNDFQVKIRGHRIELGEIENALSSLDEVNRACVLVKEKNGSKYLVAYYVADEKLPEDDIIASLTEALPEYMIPSAVVYMEEFPVTINGKLDRRALPDPDFSNEESYIAPTNDLERKICEIWQEVLNLEKVGITDDFFRIGGTSIIALRLIQKMNQISSEEQLEFNLVSLFKYKTIVSLIAHTANNKNGVELIRNLSERDEHKKKLIFLPPGAAGAEAYVALANKLKAQYYSMGVNNYNLLHEQQITDFIQMTKTYINALPSFDPDEEINLCGWSLGGKYALEMAYMLEQQGHTNINVYLLDTMLHKQPESPTSQMDQEEAFAIQREHFLSEGYEASYIDKMLQVTQSESIINEHNISGKLNWTNVVLFRATEEYNLFGLDAGRKMHEYSQTKESYDVDKFANNLKVINIPCNHRNIVEYIVENEELISVLVESGSDEEMIEIEL